MVFNLGMSTNNTFRCSACQTFTRVPAEDNMPICSGCGGFVFDTEIVEAVAPNVTFSAAGSDADYFPGDPRPYNVLRKGHRIGILEGLRGDWVFANNDGRIGRGTTRIAAVADGI